MEIVGETRNGLIIKHSIYVIRVPKDPKAIPAKSIVIEGSDKTGDVVKLVEKWLKEKEKEKR